MKRFHVHIAVNDLPASIDFYSKLFGQAPSKQQPDYAKWMLDDPRVNFALSSRGHATGVNHFGMQVETAAELAQLKTLADVASAGSTLDQGAAACCYANSDKHWTIDPQGLAWEHFMTLSEAAVFGQDTATRSDAADAAPGGACCVPLHGGRPSNQAGGASQAGGACCAPGAAAGEDAESGA